MKHSFPSTTLTRAKLTFPRALLKTFYQLITAPYKTSYHLLFSVRAKSCVWVSWISVLKGREYFVRRKQEKPAWFKLQLVLNPNAIEMVKNRACPLTSVINDSVALSLFRLISISLMTRVSWNKKYPPTSGRKLPKIAFDVAICFGMDIQDSFELQSFWEITYEFSLKNTRNSLISLPTRVVSKTNFPINKFSDSVFGEIQNHFLLKARK